MNRPQRLSNWAVTGNHTTCPSCHSPDVVVAYFVYPTLVHSVEHAGTAGSSYGWRYHCNSCHAGGPAEQKGKKCGQESQNGDGVVLGHIG